MRSIGIKPSELKSPAELYINYFKDVIENIDYGSVFGVDLSSLIPRRSLQYIKDLVKVIEGMRPETFSSDFLGSMFHSVIPLVVRKPLATYYTNQSAAALLAGLTIGESTDKVADFACGSGTLLVSAYNRKATLLNRKLVEKDHQRFLNEDITGIDVMVFAAHLAAVQLALKHPDYLSNNVRIGVEDSLPLTPGYMVDPIEKALPFGQSKLSHFEETSKREPRGAIGGDYAGNPFELYKPDVILMNPPFTRKQRISKDYRAELRQWLSSYKDYISDSYSLWAYFILLSDKFIQDNGKLGFVLPVAILRQTTYSILREFICKNFDVRFIIVGGYRCAFSENTAFRECLMVLEKNEDISKENEARFVFLKKAPTLSNTNELLANITSEPDKDVANIKCVPQSKLQKRDDWWTFVPEPHKLTNELDFSEDKVDSLSDIIESNKELMQGLRFHKSSDFLSTENSIISQPKDNISPEFEILRELKTKVVFTDGIGNEYHIPKGKLCASLRTLSHEKRMHLDSFPDWLVIDRFDGDETFWGTEEDIDKLLKKRRKHMKTRLGDIVISGYGNYDLAAPGSCLIAVTSDEQFAPTWTCWRLRIDSSEDKKIITLYLNSTFAIAKLVEDSIEVRGSVRKWRKSKLLAMPILNPSKLADSEKKMLLDLYEEVSTAKLPSLYEQLKNGHRIRLKIDKKIASIMIENEGIDKKTIRSLQIKIADRIERWREMMEK